jgi:hypothetical protein
VSNAPALGVLSSAIPGGWLIVAGRGHPRRWHRDQGRIEDGGMVDGWIMKGMEDGWPGWWNGRGRTWLNGW